MSTVVMVVMVAMVARVEAEDPERAYARAVMGARVEMEKKGAKAVMEGMFLYNADIVRICNCGWVIKSSLKITGDLAGWVVRRAVEGLLVLVRYAMAEMVRGAAMVPKVRMEKME